MNQKVPLSCAITFDFDGMSSWISSGGTRNPSMISRGQFAVVAVPRILSLLDEYKVKASFAIPGHTACAFPGSVESIVERGHEIVHHGWVHENPADFDEQGERANLDKGLEALHKVTGQRPQGYRSPAWDFSDRTVDLLLEYGFLYDSSCMGHDFYPYYLRSGDEFSTTTAYCFGETTDLLELPVTWGLDDFPVSEFVLGMNAGLRAPTDIEEQWCGDFDYANAHCDGGLYTLTLHPQTIGRGNRLLMLERLLQHFTAEGARFETMGTYAERWKEANPLETWKSENPEFTGARSFSI
jgi:peptidoglycan/xylan/chitin deacetylase (PgdA/CDA1 family)